MPVFRVAGHGADAGFLRPVPDRRTAWFLEPLSEDAATTRRAWRSCCPHGTKQTCWARASNSLMSIDYPAGAWRIYVVDDASTDHTPDVMREKMAQYPGSVFHLRREKGGQGKAHTLNHGIRADPCRGLGRGRHDHGRRRSLRAAHAAAHGTPSGRSRCRRRHRLREGRQLSRQHHRPASSPSNTSPPRRRRGVPRTSLAALPAWPAAPSSTAART